MWWKIQASSTLSFKREEKWKREVIRCDPNTDSENDVRQGGGSCGDQVCSFSTAGAGDSGSGSSEEHGGNNQSVTDEAAGEVLAPPDKHPFILC